MVSKLIPVQIATIILLGGSATLLLALPRNSAPRGPLTPDELMAEYEQPQVYNGSSVPWYKRTWINFMDESNREQTSWRYLYIDELVGGFHQLVKERSQDERLANIIYTANLIKLIDTAHFSFNSGDSQEDERNLRRVAGPRVDDEQCARDLAEMSSQVEELSSLLESLRAGLTQRPLDEHHVRLARVLDSFGRYSSGSLLGINRAPGSHDECIATSLLRGGLGNSTGGQIEMRYCWAKMSLDKSLNRHLRERNKFEYYTDDISFASATCLPASCHTRNLGPHKSSVQMLVNNQLEMPRSIFTNKSLELDSVFCLVDDDANFGMSWSGKLCLGFMVTWLVICGAVTIARKFHARKTRESSDLPVFQMRRDFLKEGALKEAPVHQDQNEHKQPEGRIWSTLACLDLAQSWADFTDNNRWSSKTRRVDFNVLNPVKILVCLYVIFLHDMLNYFFSCEKPLETIGRLDGNRLVPLLLASTPVIDLFFMLSGMHTTFAILKRCYKWAEPSAQKYVAGKEMADSSDLTNGHSTEPSKPISFLSLSLKLAIYRYLRLAPLFALALWFRREVLPHLGSGPLWDYGFNKTTITGFCLRERWFAPLLPFNFHTALSCIGSAWSISNDIFYAFLLPPFTLMLAYKPKRTIQAMITMIALILIISFVHVGETNANILWEMGTLRFHSVLLGFASLNDVYVFPIYRLPSFLIGSLAGHALFHFEKGASTRLTWPRWFTGTATWLALVYLTAHTFGGLFTSQIASAGGPYTRLLPPFSMTVDRAIWAAAGALLVMRMSTDWNDSPLMRSFANPRLRPLARLNYANLFVHWIVITYQMNALRVPNTPDGLQAIAFFACTLMLTLPISILAHVAFEGPMDKLNKRFLMDYKKIQ